MGAGPRLRPALTQRPGIDDYIARSDPSNHLYGDEIRTSIGRSSTGGGDTGMSSLTAASGCDARVSDLPAISAYFGHCIPLITHFFGL